MYGKACVITHNMVQSDYLYFTHLVARAFDPLMLPRQVTTPLRRSLYPNVLWSRNTGLKTIKYISKSLQ